MKRRRALATARRLGGALLVLCLGTAGCHSLMFVDGPPPENRRGSAFSCTESYFWPGADTVLSGVMLGYGVLYVNTGNASRDGIGSRVFLGTLTTSAVVAGLSAAYGYRQVAACREAVRQAEDYRRWLRSAAAGASGSNAPPDTGRPTDVAK